ELLVELAGAAWTGETDVHEDLPRRPVVHLRPERTSALLGHPVHFSDQRRILDGLGFEVGADGWTVVATWRARDVTRDADRVDAGNESIALYEIARVYLPSGGKLPSERRRVGGIVEGGFFRVKGAIETLYEALKAEPRFERTQNQFVHPGKAAALEAGWVGEL